MALYDNPAQITNVLLADGWHPVMNSSFLLSGEPDDTQTEFSFTDYIVIAPPAANVLITIRGSVPNVLAVKADPRQVGQLKRDFVQPDGHLQVLKADGLWHDVPGVFA